MHYEYLSCNELRNEACNATVWSLYTLSEFQNNRDSVFIHEHAIDSHRERFRSYFRPTAYFRSVFSSHSRLIPLSRRVGHILQHSACYRRVARAGCTPLLALDAACGSCKRSTVPPPSVQHSSGAGSKQHRCVLLHAHLQSGRRVFH